MDNLQDKGKVPDPVLKKSWIRIRFILRGWIPIRFVLRGRIRFVLRDWIRIRIRFVMRGWIRLPIGRGIWASRKKLEKEKINK